MVLIHIVQVHNRIVNRTQCSVYHPLLKCQHTASTSELFLLQKTLNGGEKVTLHKGGEATRVLVTLVTPLNSFHNSETSNPCANRAPLMTPTCSRLPA